MSRYRTSPLPVVVGIVLYTITLLALAPCQQAHLEQREQRSYDRGFEEGLSLAEKMCPDLERSDFHRMGHEMGLEHTLPPRLDESGTE